MSDFNPAIEYPAMQDAKESITRKWLRRVTRAGHGGIHLTQDRYPSLTKCGKTVGGDSFFGETKCHGVHTDRPATCPQCLMQVELCAVQSAYFDRKHAYIAEAESRGSTPLDKMLLKSEAYFQIAAIEDGREAQSEASK
jgi:hypothetical protein